MSKSLVQLFSETKGSTDKNTLHSYAEFYEQLFAPIRKPNWPISLLEIGVRDGSSLEVWADYFGEDAMIVGVDNGSESGFPEKITRKNIDFVIADTTRPQDFIDLVDPFGPLFDIIIDDGCHHPYAQAATFAICQPMLESSGIYVCEDIEDISFANKLCELFGGKVYDRRHVKGRHDDILWVYSPERNLP